MGADAVRASRPFFCKMWVLRASGAGFRKKPSAMSGKMSIFAASNVKMLCL